VQAGIVGYRPFHYRYASGREGDTFKIGLASRAGYIALYACAADERGYVYAPWRSVPSWPDRTVLERIIALRG
jgi:hypothetical protein